MIMKKSIKLLISEEKIMYSGAEAFAVLSNKAGFQEIFSVKSKTKS